ncbi:MAG: response regulator, partial [Microvirga sp.]
GPNDLPDGARFISKPYQPSALVRTLRAVVRAA